mmetsp:Transcript_49620/g.153202  ORF Transcript_49620/g.153202 Transcript_49620/m.153202 type:complete len:323 (-) Transcript_49620:97-1065(-)
MPPKKAGAKTLAAKKTNVAKQAIGKAKRLAAAAKTPKGAAAKRTASAGALESIWAAGSLRHGGPEDRWTLESPSYRSAVEAGKKPLHLAYFAIRALGELPKLCLEYTRTPYKCDVCMSGPVFLAMKESLPFGRLPVVYNFDGKGTVLTQSDAIVRYVARHCGMAGADSREEAVVDMLYMEWKDHCQGSNFSIEALAKGGDLRAVPDWNTVPRVNDLSPFQASMSGLRVFEKLLKASKSGWLAGGRKATYVDLALWKTLFEMEEEDNCGAKWAAALKLPELKKFKAKVESNAALMEYLRSDRLMPRMGPGYVYKAGKFSEPPC